MPRPLGSGPHCSRVTAKVYCVLRGPEERVKEAGGVTWPRRWAVLKPGRFHSQPFLKQPGQKGRLQTIKGHFLMLLGPHLGRRSRAQEARRTLPWCLPAHTPHDSGAPSEQLGGPARTSGPSAPRAVSGAGKIQSRTLSSKVHAPPGVHCPPQAPTHQQVSQGPLKRQSQTTWTQALP